ncbi:MAG: hypothetical protein KF832_27655 [Caldilineaceae bacterium]|nr:hypothetical protein [Caldilineaceae bacterium]
MQRITQPTAIATRSRGDQPTLSPPQMHTGQLRLEGTDAVDWLIADEEAVYWTNGLNSAVYRYPFPGGTIETVATTHYPNGSLSMIRPLRTENWLVFVDVARQTLSTPFRLRALNLQTGSEQQLALSDAEELPPPAFNVAGDWVVWTLLAKSQDSSCLGGETVITIHNLATGEQRQLDRACIDDNYLWNANAPIGISSTHVVVDQMLPDAQGAGERVYLFDLMTGQATSLTGEQNGSFPALSEDWVAWKIMVDASDPGSNTRLLNLHTGERQEIPTSFYADEPFIAANRWLYWDDLGGNEHVVYDLTTGERLTVVTTMQPDTSTTAWRITDYAIVWATDYVNPRQPDQREVVIQWRTGADIQQLLTAMQP